ncbi:C-type lectin domain family 5 member A-like [Tiliqua scincoides]|uniref:C-type lectin domain family 5 member A-like n=1 Tax=Tiliqua scincoides TaxID=71010 RepID=UPI0034623166
MDWQCVAPGLIFLLVKLTAASLFVVFIPQIFPRGNISFVSEENSTVLQISQNPSGITTTSSTRATTATTMKTQVPWKPLIWERYGGSYYWFSEGMLEWINSRAECIKQNSGLVIINDKKELEFIHNKTEMGNYYIGLTLEANGNEMKWLWEDGTELDKSLFSMRPATMDEECATIRAGEVRPVSCHQQSHWICEKMG